jgi:hypothetical protein
MWLLLLAGMCEAFLHHHMKWIPNLQLRKGKARAPPSHRPLRFIKASQGLTVIRTFLGTWKIPNGTGWAKELLGGLRGEGPVSG